MSTPLRKGESLPDVPRSAWSIKELAATLGVNYFTVRRMVADREVKSFRVGGEYRIPDSELQRLLACEESA